MNNDNKTLVILTPGFPADESDTTCLPLQQQLIYELASLYPTLKIKVLAFQYPYFKKEYSWHGLTVRSFNGRNASGLRKFFLRNEIQSVLKKIHLGQDITLLSFWYGECARTGELFSRKYHLPHYCWILGQDAKKENPYPSKYPISPDRLIALSDFTKEEMEKNHRINPSSVIAPGVKENKAVAEKTIDLLCVGSLIPLKQFDKFIEIVTSVHKSTPGIKAMILGEGPERSKLESLIRQYQLENNCSLAGELPHQEVINLMKQSRILLHPSSYEGFGVVCLEALAAGAKVVSFVKPMNQQIPGWYVVPNQEEMAKTALTILTDNNTTYSPFLWRSITNVAKDFYDRLFFTTPVQTCPDRSVWAEASG
jgi:glycosyltransferase involved in cell wall biosynthesis